MQALRDNPECAKQQFECIADDKDPGLTASLSFDINDNIVAPYQICCNSARLAE
jgi:phosphoribosylformylglycinamidine synthase